MILVNNNFQIKLPTESIHFDLLIFDSPTCIKNHKKIWFVMWITIVFLIFDSHGRIVLFLILIHFDLRFKVILLILIRFWFVPNRDTSANHDSPVSQNWIESKIKGRWIVIHSFANHWLIRFQLKSELKWIANHAGPSSEILILNNSFFFPYWRDFFLISKKSGPFKILQVFKGSSVGTSEIIFNRIILNRFSTFRNAMIT